MAKDELSQTLDRLHLELSQSPQVDDQTLRSMRTLVEEIQAIIAKSGVGEQSQPAPPLSINQRLQDLISDFEVRHPQLTATLSQIADRLTDMGI